MSIEAVRSYLKSCHPEINILEFPDSTATVDLAAQALGVEPARIAKSLSLYNQDGAMVLVTAGDVKLDNQKFRQSFSFKPKMLSPALALSFTGHPVGGICPFALPADIPVYLDRSLQRFETVFPACGTAHSAVELTPFQLEQYSHCRGWVDVCKGW